MDSYLHSEAVSRLIMLFLARKIYIIVFRDVAQSGSAPHWGCGGRRFKSGHPDHSF